MNYRDLVNPTSDDCLARVYGRFLRVLYDKGILGSIFTTNYLKVLPIMIQQGLSPKIIHAVLARTIPDRTAVVDDHRSLTYQEMNNEINQTAHFLNREFGVTPESNVSIMMENRSEYLVSWFALNRLAASPVHTSFGLKEGELEYQIKDSGGDVILTSSESLETALNVRRSTDIDLDIICVDDTDEDVKQFHSSIESYPTGFPEVQSTESSSDNIVYTSGTTGDPKGASRKLETPEELLSKVGFISESLGLLEKIPLHAGDRQLIVTPVYHSAGQAFSLLQMLLGGTVYLRPRFEARDTLEKLCEWDINNIFLVATLIRRILNLPDEVLAANPTPKLKGMIFSAAPFPQTLREKTIEQFGEETVHELYGATELGLITHIRGDDMVERPGSVGKPLSGQKIKILDDDGEELEPNEVGKIFVQNEEIMEGYLGEDKELGEIELDNWFTLDDLGYLDEDGYLYLTGRARDMVITGGVNVYPVQIENVLEQHDSVNETAVIGVPHEEWGEMLVAYVVPSGDEFSETELDDFARNNLHKAKVPKEWIQINELPRTSTGKVQKKQLEEQYEERISDNEEMPV